ncbi:MAG: hypothetical protein ACFWUE_03335 [Xylanivirga thermophila]|jgi:uncharacterized protein YjdB
MFKRFKDFTFKTIALLMILAVFNSFISPLNITLAEADAEADYDDFENLDNWNIVGKSGTIEINPPGELHVKLENSKKIPTLCNKTIGVNEVFNRYELEFKCRVKQGEKDNAAFWINIQTGSRRLFLGIGPDGVYADAGNYGIRRIKDIEIGNGWHVWRAVVDENKVDVYMDGDYIARFVSIPQDKKISNNSPIRIFWIGQEDSTIEFYIDYLKFKNISPDATLSDLIISEGTLISEFNRGTYYYDLSAQNTTENITIVPTAYDKNATITVNNKIVKSGEASHEITYEPGTSITIEVTLPNGDSNIYRISLVMSRGYTVPIVDISDQTQRQVLVDKEPGQYLGHTSTVLLDDGKTIIAVYPRGHGRGPIVMKRSSDEGLTWGERLPTPESWETSRELPTIYKAKGPDGVQRLLLFSGLYPIRMSYSEDSGNNWTELKPIGDYGGIVAVHSLIELKNGTLMALFHDDGRFIRGGPNSFWDSPAGSFSGFKVYKIISEDGGLSWSQPEIIAEHPTAYICEPCAIRSPDGKQIAVLLRENSRKYNSFVIFSNDEGQTWSDPMELPAALTGDQHKACYSPDGRLVVVFRDTTQISPTKGDFVGWVGTYDDIVNRREGQYRVRFMKNYEGSDCAYAGLELLPDGTFVTTSYGHWEKEQEPYIMSVRFTLDELDASLPNVPVTGIELNQTELHLKKGEGQKIVATVYPKNATNRGVVWETSDASIAIVDDEGTVSGISEGTATIIAKTIDGSYKARCSVIVSDIDKDNDRDDNIIEFPPIDEKIELTPITEGNVHVLADEIIIKSKAHMQTIADRKYEGSGLLELGSIENSKRLEQFSLELQDAPEDMKILYMAHIQTDGDSKWIMSPESVGSRGEKKRIEGIGIKLVDKDGNPYPGYSVKYQVHMQSLGWGKDVEHNEKINASSNYWASDGEFAGTRGMKKRVEAIRVKIVKEEKLDIEKLESSSYITVKFKKPIVDVSGINFEVLEENKNINIRRIKWNDNNTEAILILDRSIENSKCKVKINMKFNSAWISTKLSCDISNTFPLI